jgi:hypothetical protein
MNVPVLDKAAKREQRNDKYSLSNQAANKRQNSNLSTGQGFVGKRSFDHDDASKHKKLKYESEQTVRPNIKPKFSNDKNPVVSIPAPLPELNPKHTQKLRTTKKYGNNGLEKSAKLSVRTQMNKKMDSEFSTGS